MPVIGQRASGCKAPKVDALAGGGAVLTVLLAVLVIVGCRGHVRGEPIESSGAVAACEPNLESITANIFVPTCAEAGCHAAPGAAAALNLSGDHPETALLNVAAGTCDGWVRVAPGSPEQSLLWLKLYSDSPPCGARMPLAGHLPATQLGCIREWIRNLPADAGAAAETCEMCGGSSCVELSSDPSHCGSCDVACPAGAACEAGQCMCGPGLAACGTLCVDTQANASHCGGCDKTCPTGALCNVGECVCASGLEACGNVCVDTSSDVAHCGGCDKPCGTGKVCLLGMCSDGCGALTQCGSSCVDTQSSTFNCSGCGISCPVGASCVNAACACPGGTSNCNNTCINTYSDSNNCGGCGLTCASGLTCEAAKCQCPGGETPCGSTCVDTTADSKNCGGCGIVCGIGQTCTNGSCTCAAAGSVSFSSTIQPIFTNNCATRGCHSGTKPQASLDLSVGAAYANLVNVASSECSPSRLRVMPKDPGRSYLMNKLMGVNLCTGSQMPKAGTSLPGGDLQSIGAWICAGALEN